MRRFIVLSATAIAILSACKPADLFHELSGPPTLILPTENAVFPTPAVHFEWTAVEFAESYDVILNDEVITSTMELAFDYTIANPDPSGYVWQVRAAHKFAHYPSVIRRFYIQTTAPTPLTPCCGCTICEDAQTFTWAPSLQTDEYEIRIKDAAGADVGGTPARVTSASYTPSPALPIGGYTWEVVAFANGVELATSANCAATFARPDAPVIVSPTASQVFCSPIGVSVDFTWTAVAWAGAATGSHTFHYALTDTSGAPIDSGVAVLPMSVDTPGAGNYVLSVWAEESACQGDPTTVSFSVEPPIDPSNLSNDSPACPGVLINLTFTEETFGSYEVEIDATGAGDWSSAGVTVNTDGTAIWNAVSGATAWRVRHLYQTCASAWVSESLSVIDGSVLPTSLNSPSACAGTDIFLTWLSGQPTGSYSVEVDYGLGFVVTGISAVTSTGATLNTSTTGTFAWRVTHDAAPCPPLTEVGTVTVTSAPAAPTLTLIPNDCSPPYTGTFAWTVLPGLTYDLEWTSGALTGTPTIPGATSPHDPSPDLGAATWSWGVRACDGSCCGPWATQTFSVSAGGSVNQWTLKTPSPTPPGRWGVTLVWSGTKAYAFGGCCSPGYLHDLWEYDPAAGPQGTWTQKTPTPFPADRGAHTAVWANNVMLVFGGLGAVYYNGIWTYDPTVGPQGTWTQKTPASPPTGRFSINSCWSGTHLMTFGGFDGTFAADTWMYNPTAGPQGTWYQKFPTSPPSGRDGSIFAWDGNKMIMFGGWTGSVALNDTWFYDPAVGPEGTWTLKTPVGPPPGRGQGMGVWTGCAFVIFGGWPGGPQYNDTWSYDPTAGPQGTWTNKMPTGPPSGRSQHSAAWTGSVMYMFGGDGSPSNDIWVYTP